MATVTVHEAKTQLSDLLRRVEAGEEIIIARGDKPVVVLKAYKIEDVENRRKAGMGSMPGQFPPVPDGAFFDPLTDGDMVELFGDDFAALHNQSNPT